MWSAFNAGPGLKKLVIIVAGVNLGLGRSLAGVVADRAIDAAVVDSVARSEWIGIIDKGSVGDAAVFCASVATEAVDRVKYERLGKVSGFFGLVPVPIPPILSVPNDANRFISLFIKG
jgi:hypothetical protein